MADAPRRFPPPWRADRTPHGYVVRDANGQELAGEPSGAIWAAEGHRGRITAAAMPSVNWRFSQTAEAGETGEADEVGEAGEAGEAGTAA
jgi:hypothetical protein